MHEMSLFDAARNVLATAGIAEKPAAARAMAAAGALQAAGFDFDVRDLPTGPGAPFETAAAVWLQCRDGAPDADIAALWAGAQGRKAAAHGIGEPGFVPPVRTMSAIGG